MYSVSVTYALPSEGVLTAALVAWPCTVLYSP
jgi:hypothetical protein